MCKERKNEEHESAECAERAEFAEQNFGEGGAEQGAERHESQGADGEQNFRQNQLENFCKRRKVVQVKGKKSAGPMRSPYDVNGSYTGTPPDGGRPVQDADDL